MPYTPRTRTSRAHMDGSLQWENVPSYSAFVVPFSHNPIGSGVISDPVARAAHNSMINSEVGSWANGGFTPARAGWYRLATQFAAFKTSSQARVLDVFHRIEMIREGSGIVLSITDSIDHLIDQAQRVVALKAEASVYLLTTDHIQARFGFIEGDNLNIVTDHMRTYFDVTAYWN